MSQAQQGGNDQHPVLLHINPSNPAELFGVWFPPDGSSEPPRSYYPGADTARSAAASVIDDCLQYREWDRLVPYLCARLPYSIWWDDLLVPVSMSDTDVFEAAATAVEERAQALHGQSSGGWTARMLTGNDAAAAAATTPGARLAALAGISSPRFEP